MKIGFSNDQFKKPEEEALREKIEEIERPRAEPLVAKILRRLLTLSLLGFAYTNAHWSVSILLTLLVIRTELGGWFDD